MSPPPCIPENFTASRSGNPAGSKFALDQATFKNEHLGKRPRCYFRRTKSLHDLRKLEWQEENPEISYHPPRRLRDQRYQPPAESSNLEQVDASGKQVIKSEKHEDQAPAQKRGAPGIQPAEYSYPVCESWFSSMPNRFHVNAPRFDGQPDNLTPFFEDIEDLANACSLPDNWKIHFTLKYIASVEDLILWKTYARAAVKTGDWEQFKKRVYTLYPEVAEPGNHTFGSLNALVEKQAKVPIKGPSDVGEYYRKFLPIVDCLKNKEQLTSDALAGHYFLQGVHPTFRELVERRLRIMYPRHEWDMTWELKDAYKAAVHVSTQDEIDRRVDKNTIRPQKQDLTTIDALKILEAMLSNQEFVAQIHRALDDRMGQGNQRHNKRGSCGVQRGGLRLEDR